MDEVELPPALPSTRPSSVRQKRTRTDDDPTTSSDPALFSSDEHGPTSETYAHKRQKKQWRGTWWGDEHGRVPTSRKKTKMKRNYDSGVFMGSDETDTSVEEAFQEEQQSTVPPRQHTLFSQDRSTSTDVRTKRNSGHPTKIDVVSPPHRKAREIIHRCLEDGNEDIDLSLLHLETLPDEVAELKSLTKHSMIHDPPTSQDAYAPIEAQIRLYLANNALRKIPSALFELRNLGVLSLRQNELTKIPQAVCNLVNLRTLNVAGNQLRYLPYEVFELMRFHNLRELITASNPWQEMKEEHQVSSTLLECQQGLKVWKNGVAILPHADGDGDSHGGNRMNSPSHAARESSGPSLTETVLRRLQTMPEILSFDQWLPEDTPEAVQGMLGAAKDAYESGGRVCSSCRRRIVLPRCERIEWWRVQGPSATLVEGVPFIQQFCSQPCAGQVSAGDVR